MLRSLVGSEMCIRDRTDPCHLSLASDLAGTSDCVVVFCTYSSPFSAHPGQLFSGVRNIWNRFDLIGTSRIRFDVLHFRLWSAEEGAAYMDYDVPSGAVSTLSDPSTSIGTAENRAVHAGPLHYFRHACRRHACDRPLLLGDDLVVQIRKRVGERSLAGYPDLRISGDAQISLLDISRAGKREPEMSPSFGNPNAESARRSPLFL